MGVQPARVVEVFSKGASGGRVASGYLLERALILTAGHAVGQEPQVLLVRPLGTANWLPARVAWSGSGTDAALLAVGDADPRNEGKPPDEGELPDESFPHRLAWGRLQGSEPVSVTAVGFPW